MDSIIKNNDNNNIQYYKHAQQKNVTQKNNPQPPSPHRCWWGRGSDRGERGPLYSWMWMTTRMKLMTRQDAWGVLLKLTLFIEENTCRVSWGKSVLKEINTSLESLASKQQYLCWKCPVSLTTTTLFHLYIYAWVAQLWSGIFVVPLKDTH